MSPAAMNENASTKYERWIWIELIGFDNTRPDCGAAEYLDKLGFVPDALSYLITSPDIIHHHDGLEDETVLPPDCCSYCGHPRNSERERQVWTNHQLRTLTHALQARGIKVFLATFTFFLNDTFHEEWLGDYPELFETRRNGETITALQPLKRFADGNFYEDFFIERLTRVLSDYDFDGWHAADGWGPARLPLNETDYSNDMFEQFVHASGVEVPTEIAMQCAEYSQYEARADWIWREQRRAWIDFYTERWAIFYRKKVAAIKALGKEIVINSAWTRDPFEAIYRYGVDYRKIIAAGVDGIVTESAAGASDMEAETGFRLDNYVGALLLMRAAVPSTRLVFLHGVKDTKEQWDLIHHAPTILEKETLCLSNIYLQNGQAQMQRCADGLVVCLGDGISEEEWRWLRARWEIAFDVLPERLLGATLVWSDRALDNEIDDFIAQRGATTHHLLYKLTEQGAPIQSIVRIENLENARGAILVLNSHLLPADERQRLREYSGGPVITIGRETAPSAEDAARHSLVCRVSGSYSDGENKPQELRSELHGDPLSPGTAVIEEPITFLENLIMNEPGSDFIQECAQRIVAASEAFRVASDEKFVTLQAMKFRDNRVRVITKNNRLSYVSPLIETGKRIESVRVISEFPCTQIEPDGSQFRIKIPGRGSVVADLYFSGGEGNI